MQNRLFLTQKTVDFVKTQEQLSQRQKILLLNLVRYFESYDNLNNTDKFWANLLRCYPVDIPIDLAYLEWWEYIFIDWDNKDYDDSKRFVTLSQFFINLLDELNQ